MGFLLKLFFVAFSNSNTFMETYVSCSAMKYSTSFEKVISEPALYLPQRCKLNNSILSIHRIPVSWSPVNICT